MRRVTFACLAALPVFAAAPALAQAPQTEKNISMGLALAIIQGTLEQCTKDGYKVSITIVDKGGAVAAQIRGDGTSPHTMEFSKLKAYTSRIRGVPSSAPITWPTSNPAYARPASAMPSTTQSATCSYMS